MHHNKRQQRFAAILFIVSTLQLFCLVYYYSTIYMTTVLEIQPQTNHPEIDGTATLLKIPNVKSLFLYE